MWEGCESAAWGIQSTLITWEMDSKINISRTPKSQSSRWWRPQLLLSLSPCQTQNLAPWWFIIHYKKQTWIPIKIRINKNADRKKKKSKENGWLTPNGLCCSSVDRPRRAFCFYFIVIDSMLFVYFYFIHFLSFFGFNIHADQYYHRQLLTMRGKRR